VEIKRSYDRKAWDDLLDIKPGDTFVIANGYREKVFMCCSRGDPNLVHAVCLKTGELYWLNRSLAYLKRRFVAVEQPEQSNDTT